MQISPLLHSHCMSTHELHTTEDWDGLEHRRITVAWSFFWIKHTTEHLLIAMLHPLQASADKTSWQKCFLVWFIVQKNDHVTIYIRCKMVDGWWSGQSIPHWFSIEWEHQLLQSCGSGTSWPCQRDVHTWMGNRPPMHGVQFAFVLCLWGEMAPFMCMDQSGTNALAQEKH